MTASNTNPIPVAAPHGAVHVGDWALSGDERIAHRWFHCGEHTTPGGLRIKVHGMQYSDGSADGLSIAISDDHGDVTLNPGDAEHLVAHLTDATAQLSDLRRASCRRLAEPNEASTDTR